jgi:hypothetical protein
MALRRSVTKLQPNCNTCHKAKIFVALINKRRYGTVAP